jgi:hypothetical protein
MRTHIEPPRTRQHGTQVHRARTAEECITAAKSVLESGYAKVNNEMLDQTTASMLVSVRDAIAQQSEHPDYWDRVERVFAKIHGDGSGQKPRAALRWLVNFGWRLVN